MKHTRSSSDRRSFAWALVAGTLATGLTFWATPANAGPKGTIVVRPLGNAKITMDGDFKDWPLDKFTKVAEQPLFPEGQSAVSTNAVGDHVVFDVRRVGFFNDTKQGAFEANDSDFGATLYYAYDSKFLYILGVFIDDVLRGDKDSTEFGSEGFRNDGVELLLDMKGDSTGCFVFNSDTAPDRDNVQIAISLNDNFKPEGAGAEVLGARQTLLSNAAPDLLGSGVGQPGGIWRDALDASTKADGQPDIAVRRYGDLRAAGARNPEIAAKPNVTFTGYAFEMRVPFNAGGQGIPDFTPDHAMGIEMFWRDVDNADSDPASDPGAGALDESWALWAQSTTVACDDSSLKMSLYNTANWGQLTFDKANPLVP
jgi:hypothetical protein